MNKFVALALTAALLGSALAQPAMAQQQRFGVFFGDEPRDFFPERIMCLTDLQIRTTVASLGYTNIFLNVPNKKHIQVRATRDGWVYLLDFNFCTGQIDGSQELRRAN
ncbi:hypothetical protein [Devosia sp. 2618]|uniref:hypothetical protein n=1 Tax=Devosia sp. 2618 TaxID=3156454 RepID=UPI0033945379